VRCPRHPHGARLGPRYAHAHKRMRMRARLAGPRALCAPGRLTLQDKYEVRSPVSTRSGQGPTSRTQPLFGARVKLGHKRSASRPDKDGN